MTELNSNNEADYDLGNKNTIERFGEKKCLEAYDIASNYTPFMPSNKHSTWQEEVASELNVSDSEAMDLWIAGDNIIQKEREKERGNKSHEIFEKLGKEKFEKIYNDIFTIIISDKEWNKNISVKYGISQSDVFDVFSAGTELKMKSSAPGVAEAIRNHHNNKEKRPPCPKEMCDGKLNVGVSLSEDLQGLYFCDTCYSKFKKK